MTKFKVGDTVKLQDYPGLEYLHIPEFRGVGPYRVSAVEEVSPAYQPSAGHSQLVTILRLGAGEKYSGAWLKHA